MPNTARRMNANRPTRRDPLEGVKPEPMVVSADNPQILALRDTGSFLVRDASRWAMNQMWHGATISDFAEKLSEYADKLENPEQ